MLIYFLLFSALGFFIARQVKDTENGFIIVLSIACISLIFNSFSSFKIPITLYGFKCKKI